MIASLVKGVFRGKVKDTLIVKVIVDTTRQSSEKQPIFHPTEQFKDANRYQKNLEIIQQHQQQQ